MTEPVVADDVVDAVRRVASAHRTDLERLKIAAAKPERRDLWLALLRSFGTLGGSAPWEILRLPKHLDRLAYRSLVAIKPAARAAAIEKVFRAAQVRYPEKKARQLASNVEKIRQLGGPERAQATFDALATASEIMDFLQQFDGIAKKYARNIPMDSYDPHFRGMIAIDKRIKSISKAIGLPPEMEYEDEERYYIALARRVGLEPWELDRLLYGFKDDVLRELSAVARA